MWASSAPSLTPRTSCTTASVSLQTPSWAARIEATMYFNFSEDNRQIFQSLYERAQRILEARNAREQKITLRVDMRLRALVLVLCLWGVLSGAIAMSLVKQPLRVEHVNPELTLGPI